MIRVALATEPSSFDGAVRKPGLDAIRELVGETPLKTRRGPKRKKIAASRDAIPTGIDVATATKVDATITRLKLNDENCLKARREYARSYQDGEIELSYLERRSPFIAQELRRQGKLRQGDV